MKNKFYINPDTDELIIVSLSDDGGSLAVMELPCLDTLEYENDEEEEEELEEAPVVVAPKERTAKRLTDEERKQIKSKLAAGEKPKAIAEEFRTSYATVMALRKKLETEPLPEGSTGEGGQPKKVYTTEELDEKVSDFLEMGKRTAEIAELLGISYERVDQSIKRIG